MAEHETVRGAVTGGGLARTAQVPPSASRRPAQDDAGRSSSESSSESKRSNTSATAFGQGVLRRDATDLLHHRLHRRAPDHQNARLVRSRAGEGVGSPAWHEHEGAGVNTVAACIAQHELHLEHGSGRPAPRRLPQPATPVRTRSRGGRVATRLALLQPLPIAAVGYRATGTAVSGVVLLDHHGALLSLHGCRAAGGAACRPEWAAHVRASEACGSRALRNSADSETEPNARSATRSEASWLRGLDLSGPPVQRSVRRRRRLGAGSSFSSPESRRPQGPDGTPSSGTRSSCRHGGPPPGRGQPVVSSTRSLALARPTWPARPAPRTGPRSRTSPAPPAHRGTGG